jgi:hypothetical protein
MGRRVWSLLAFVLVGCGGNSTSNGSASHGGAGSSASGASGTNSAGSSGSAGHPDLPTDGSESCAASIRTSGTFAGSELYNGRSFSSSLLSSRDPGTWFASYAWPGHSLELRGAGTSAPPFAEGSEHGVDYGFFFANDALPWHVACVAAGSMISIVNQNQVYDLNVSPPLSCPGTPVSGSLTLCQAD